jgi:hypothetical protein
MKHDVDYQGPPRRREDVIAAALADEELMRQTDDAIDEIRRGGPGVPLRQIIEEQRRRGSA